MLNLDSVARNDIEENEKVCHAFDVKDLFCEEELATLLKGLRKNEAPSY